jgi:hypothetical protein
VPSGDRSADVASARAALKADIETVKMLEETLSMLRAVADGEGALARALPLCQREAAAGLRRGVSFSAVRDVHGGPVSDYTVAADALLLLLGWLRDATSIDAVQQSLKTAGPAGDAAFEAVSRLCGHAGIHVRQARDGAGNVIPEYGPSKPVPAAPPAVYRFGQSAVSVSLAELAAGDGPFKADAQSALTDIIRAVDALHKLWELGDRNLEGCKDGTVTGARAYLLLHGQKFDRLPAGSDARAVLHHLRDVCEAACKLILKAGGYPRGVRPDLKTMAVLLGDAHEQLEHFDVMLLRQLVLLLSPGHSTLALPGLPVGKPTAVLKASVSELLGEPVPDLVGFNGEHVGRVEAATYWTNGEQLLRSARGSAVAVAPELMYSHVRPGLCAAGTATIGEASFRHLGPGPFAGFRDAPDPRSTLAQEHALYSKVPAAQVLMHQRGRWTPPRVSLFVALLPGDSEHREGAQPLFVAANSYSTQHRADVFLDNINAWGSLPGLYLRMFERGHTYVPDFLQPSDKEKWKLATALRRAWESNDTVRMRTLSAAFPSVFGGVSDVSETAMAGLELYEKMTADL